MLLTREQIMDMELKQEIVEVLEWGGSVTIRELTGEDRDALEAATIIDDKVNLENLRSKVLAMSLIDADGNHMFTIDEASALAKKSGKIVVRLYAIAKRLSGLGEDELTNLVKKSEPNDTKEDSSSD